MAPDADGFCYGERAACWKLRHGKAKAQGLLSEPVAETKTRCAWAGDAVSGKKESIAPSKVSDSAIVFMGPPVTKACGNARGASLPQGGRLVSWY